MPTSSAPGGSISVNASITVASDKTVITKNFPNGTRGAGGASHRACPSGGQSFSWVVPHGFLGGLDMCRDLKCVPTEPRSWPCHRAQERPQQSHSGTVAFRINQDGSSKTDAVKLEWPTRSSGAWGGEAPVPVVHAQPNPPRRLCSPPFLNGKPLIECERQTPADRRDGPASCCPPSAVRSSACSLGHGVRLRRSPGQQPRRRGADRHQRVPR